MADSDQIPGEMPFEEPASLRFLRRMVTALTITMIIGMVVIALSIALVARKESRKLLNENPLITLASQLRLGVGEQVVSLSISDGRLFVVVRDAEGQEWLSVRDAATDQEQQRLAIR